MHGKPRRFGRDVKIAAVRRMLAGENVRALSQELAVLRKDLYSWRRKFLAGGPDALREPGRPRRLREAVPTDAPVTAPKAALTKAHRRIAELERKVVRQQKDIESIRQALQAREKPGRQD
jgi:hypothetical protein